MKVIKSNQIKLLITASGSHCLIKGIKVIKLIKVIKIRIRDIIKEIKSFFILLIQP